MDADLLLFCLTSWSVVLNLTTIKHQRGQEELYIQIWILIVLIFSLKVFHNDESFGNAYVPNLLAISDALLSRASCHSTVVENIWSRRPVLQICIRSIVPASLLWIYSDMAFRTKSALILFGPSMVDTCKITIFGVSWLGCFFLRIQSRRKLLNTALKYSLPLATNDISHPDERNWEYWNNLQCRSWIIFNYHGRILNMSEDDLYRILGIFKKERICGEALKFLKKEDFVAMGLSHGDSALIFSDILNLTSRYPSQKRENSTTIDLEEWLGKKIGQTPIKPPPLDPTQVFDINGASLNSFAAGDQTRSENDYIPSDTDLESIPEDMKLKEIDPDLINSMPPNVREIASRRPDLVRALFSQRQLSGSNAKSGLQLESTDNLHHFGLEDGTLDNPTNEIEQDDWSSMNNRHEHEEMIGLLRRRRNNIV